MSPHLPYRGYVPGVFDMFHVGHLNIVRAARARCQHLTVGVVADEVVTRVKGHPPVVPLAERMEIVAAIQGVDRVVVDVHADKFDAWREVRFDVLFKGDDWRGTPRGDKLESDLATVGARVVYFPYTRHTSSTQLRQALEGRAAPPAWAPEPAGVAASDNGAPLRAALVQEKAS